MAYYPPDGRSIHFTDWSAIRASLGRDDVRGDSPPADRQAVIDELARSQAVAAPFAFEDLAHHREAWGFDNLDLHWEAMIDIGHGPTHVLQFESGFDFATLIARLEAHGFETREHGGVTIRSRELDGSEHWLATTDAAIGNTAFLPDGLTLFLAEDRRDVEAVIDHLADPGAMPRAWLGVIDQMSGASAATITTDGEDVCFRFDPRARPHVPGSELVEQLDAAEPLHQKDALGIGYSRTWDPIGRIAFGYLDPATADADLPGRRAIAETGINGDGEQYSEFAFTLEAAEAADGTITLHVAPLEDVPSHLLDLYTSGDMTFAAC